MLNGKRWKKTGSLPLQAMIADKKLLNYIKTIDNTWVQTPLRVQRTLIKENKLEEDIGNLKWCAYDSDFAPNKYDTRF